MSGAHRSVDRLEGLKDRLKTARVYYSVPNPQADYQMDIVDASDDYRWMIYEIERLRAVVPENVRRGPL